MKRQILSVSDVTRAISIALSEKVGYVSVQGEISNFKCHSSGHRYFTMKDSGAQISCVMWKSKKLSFNPTDGMQVVVTGAINVYPPRGSYQINCETMNPLGQGNLYLAFMELKQKLEGLGYFSDDRKRPIPAFPLKIGVVTSPTGAAVRDIFTTVNRRFPLCKIYFRPASVQGAGSENEIAAAIRELNGYPLDLIIAGRGGGSLEDLWSFNTEITADAIFHSKVPVISAVGHETDFTIADFTADLRAPTPTAAAEMATPKTAGELYQHISQVSGFFKTRIESLVAEKEDLIGSLIHSYGFRSIRDRLGNYRQLADEYDARLKSYIKKAAVNKKGQLNSLISHLHSLQPLSPLKRGFAYLECDGKILSPGQSLRKFKKVNIVRQNETAVAEISKVNDVK